MYMITFHIFVSNDCNKLIIQCFTLYPTYKTKQGFFLNLAEYWQNVNFFLGSLCIFFQFKLFYLRLAELSIFDYEVEYPATPVAP